MQQTGKFCANEEKQARPACCLSGIEQSGWWDRLCDDTLRDFASRRINESILADWLQVCMLHGHRLSNEESLGPLAKLSPKSSMADISICSAW